MYLNNNSLCLHIACRKQEQKLRVASEVQQLREERDAFKEQLITVTADYEKRIQHLVDALDAVKIGAVRQSMSVLTCLTAPGKGEICDAIKACNLY